jgi:small redox-active disulfide protein 2
MQIKVLGPGCPKCEQTAKVVQEVITASGVAAEVVKVMDIKEIARHGVFITPAIVINGQVKLTGKVPSKEEILGWLKAGQ